MKLLHAADLHLAPRLAYIEDENNRRRRRKDFAAQVDRLPVLAREHAVEAVILAGDVFDRDLPAVPEVGRLHRAFQDLEKAGVVVLVAPGTHDPWRPGGIWDQRWPANVHIFRSGQWESVVVGDVAFYGIAHTGGPKEGSLFDGIPYTENARLHVGIAHASLLHAYLKERVDGKNYPFEEGELDQTHFNYLALGDHHNPNAVTRGRLTAAYPGSPEGLGLDRAEVGPRYMLVVDVDSVDDPPTLQQVQTNRREVYLDTVSLMEVQHEPRAIVAEEVRRTLLAAASPDRLARFSFSGTLEFPLDIDAAVAEAASGYFLLDVRDHTRMIPESPAAARTIRPGFEARLARTIEQARDGREAEIARRALSLGLQALEGLL